MRFTSCAGRCAKIGAAERSAVLETLARGDTLRADEPRLLVGRGTLDDAAVFRLGCDVALAFFKTGVAARRLIRWLRFPHTLASATLLLVLAASPLAAQRAAAARAAITDTIPDSLRKPPIAPRRAMLLSLVLPGYAQSRLGRPTSSIIFATGEIIALGMARKSALDLRAAKEARHDSTATGFRVDPTTGAVTATGYVQNRLAARVGARRTHYEDWIAALIFNHLISAADAYVAANLWDFHANVALQPHDRGALLAASVTF